MQTDIPDTNSKNVVERSKIKIVVRVGEEEMRDFFDGLYRFAREAEEELILIDNHHTSIEFIYSPYHREVFDEAATCRDGDTLIHQIGKFIMNHEDM